MNWNAIIAVTEIIGVLAVLVTLFYLAVQTRDNTRVMKSRAVWDAQVSFVEVNEVLGDGGTVSQLMYRVMTSSDDLSDYDKYLAHRFVRGWMQRMEAQFALYKAGILDAEVWELRLGYVKAILGNPVMAQAWQADKGNSMFTRDFIAAIDSVGVGELPTFLGDKMRADK